MFVTLKTQSMLSLPLPGHSPPPASCCCAFTVVTCWSLDVHDVCRGVCPWGPFSWLSVCGSPFMNLRRLLTSPLPGDVFTACVSQTMRVGTARLSWMTIARRGRGQGGTVLPLHQPLPPPPAAPWCALRAAACSYHDVGYEPHIPYTLLRCHVFGCAVNCVCMRTGWYAVSRSSFASKVLRC